MSLWYDELSKWLLPESTFPRGVSVAFCFSRRLSKLLASGSEPDSFKITASSLDMNLVRLCVCPLTAQSVAYNAPVLPYKCSVDFQKLGCVLISFICFYFSAGSLLSHGLSLVVASGDYSRYSAWA